MSFTNMLLELRNMLFQMFQMLGQVSCWSGLLCKGTPQEVLSLVKDVPMGSMKESKAKEKGNYCILLSITH